jgi:competence protein ComEC
MSHRLFPSGIWWKYARVQWVIGIGLIPLTLVLFQQCTLISFIANSIAIPWLAFSILPLCFLSAIFVCFSPTLTSFLLLIADKSLAGLWFILSWLAQFHFASWSMAIPNIYTFMLLMIGFLMFLLPAGVPGRWLGLIWALPAILYQPLKPLGGEYWLSLLDVGQGLSVVVQTAEHILIYDAGPKYEAASDMGENVILPYLRKIKAKKIDLMVISHGDNDHTGGVKAILNSFPLTNIKTSVPEKMPSSLATDCHAGDSWQWDGVTFTFLYPGNHAITSRNDGSCVLKIDNGQYKILLPGDIEKQAESHLLMNSPQSLQANMIIAPHHGSKTSGMPSFISAVHPEIVLYATGYRNRYHFPHPGVVAAYERINAKSFNTVDSGTMLFKIPNGGVMSPPEEFRMRNKKYWFDH